MGWMSIFENRVLLSALLGWFVAQVAKVLISVIKTKKFDRERVYGAGGMPSSHSCMVSALTVSIAMTEGVNSAIFAFAGAFAFVTMYDALGVRRQAGLHAKTLNQYMNVMQELKKQEDLQGHTESLDEELPEETGNLKEYIGHTPLEVLVGVLLGIVTAMLVCIW